VKFPVGWTLQDQVSLLILTLSLASTALEGVGVFFSENADLNPNIKKKDVYLWIPVYCTSRLADNITKAVCYSLKTRIIRTK